MSFLTSDNFAHALVAPGLASAKPCCTFPTITSPDPDHVSLLGTERDDGPSYPLVVDSDALFYVYTIFRSDVCLCHAKAL